MTAPGGENRNANVVLTADASQYQAQMAQSTQSTNHLSSALSTLTSQLDGLSKRAGKRLFQFSAVDFAGLAGMTATAATFEKQLGTLRATADVTGQSFSNMKGNIEGTFTNFPVARGEVVQLTSAISQLGITSSQTLGSLTNTFVKLGAATGENSSDLAGGLVQLSRLMGTTNAQQIGNFANSLLTVSKDAGVASGGVLNFAQSIAPLARQAGISEAAVLGISAAFTKAGADGYVAANTFNSMVSDITNLVQTGSPDLEKYAKLIGVTAGQFAKMDKTSALVGIFEAINKQGPKAIQTLNQLGFEGIRAQAAITAVVQSGNLRQSVAQALGASNDQNNLNQASKDAMSGLTDELVRLRNNFTELGTEIGTTFLTPLEKVLQIFNKMFEIFNKIIKPFAPLIAAVGAFAGALTGLAGTALITFAIISKLATLTLLSTGTPLLAFRQGVAVGRDPTVVNPASIRATEGTLRPYVQKPFYALGAGIGRTLGPTPETVGPSIASRVAGAPFLVATKLTDWTTTAIKDANMNVAPFERSGNLVSPTMERPGFFATIGSGFKRGFSGPPPPGPVVTNATLSPSGMLITDKRAAGDAVGFSGVKKAADASAKATEGATKATVAGAAATSTAAKATEGEAVAMKGFSVRVAEAGGALAGLGRASLSTGASFVGKGFGLAAQGGKALLNSPIGLLGLSFALPSIISGISGLFGKGKDYTTVGEGNDITSYDQHLGTTSTNLASFSSAVVDATAKLKQLVGTSFRKVVQVTPSDVGAASGGYKVTDPNIGVLKYGSNASAVSYIQTLAAQHGGVDAALLQNIKLDLIATVGKDRAQQILSLYSHSKGAGSGAPSINYAAFGQFGAALSNSQFQPLSDQVFSTVKSQSSLAPSPRSSAATISAFQAFLTSLTTGPNKGQYSSYATDKAGNISNQLNRYFSTGTFKDLGNPALFGQNALSQADIQHAFLFDLLRGAKDNKQIRGLLQTSGVDVSSLLKRFGGSLSASGWVSQLPDITGPVARAVQRQLNVSPAYLANAFGEPLTTGSPENKALQGSSLGQFLLQSPHLQNLIGVGGQIADPTAIAKGQQELTKQAKLTTGDMGSAATALQKLADTAERKADPALQALAESASQFARQQFEQKVLPTLNRTEQTQYYLDRVRSSRQEYLATGTDSSKQDYQSALQSYNQQTQSNEQFFIQMYQTTRNYHIQMVRSEQDYNKQILRSQQDFQIQMAHSERDYLRQRFRQQQDFNIQLKQQALQAAQSIYNPFQRVYDQQTADAGTVLMNLKDQNQRIQDQYANLKKLQAAGVSQQTIDVLNLADPSNAQQLQQLVGGITNNPNLVKAINAAVNQRQKATTQLTQSDFNATFRQTVDAFHRSFHRMAVDFNTARNDAENAEQLGLSRMGEDFSKMLDRSSEDLKNSILDVTQSFADLYPKVFNKVVDYIRKFAPQAADIIQKSLDGLHLPGESHLTGKHGSFASGSTNNPITTPGTLGINPGGQIGTYGKGGKFTVVPPQRRLGIDPGTLKHIAPPGTENANTPAGAKAYARSQLGKYGWGADQFPYLDDLWTIESGWRYTAYNPSGATGIPQALGHQLPPGFESDGRVQIDWGLQYIKNRYGSPHAADDFEHSHSPMWYDHGGVLNPGVTKTVNATGSPEIILNPNQMKALHTVGKGDVATNVFKIYNDNSTIFRDITVVASDPNMMAKQLMAKARLAKLSRPPRATTS